MSQQIYGNKRTKTVHVSARNDRCRKGQIKESNRVDFKSIDEAVEQHYKHCRHCFPVGDES